MLKENVFQIVKDNILEILPYLANKNISMEASLKDLGANSIDRMEIVTMSMERLNIKIPAPEFKEINNLAGLVDLLFEKVNGCA